MSSNLNKANKRKNIIVGSYCILRYNPYMTGKNLAEVINEIGVSNRGITSGDIGFNLNNATKKQMKIFEKAEGVNWKINPEFLRRVKK